ncbi:hypothetical protein K438DRAFT_1786487 [Mycena galopus ATCC 62051]|nr:hypothetical protein K438DRAFT_1786487 [Mycena galopus ATCC 62051]
MSGIGTLSPFSSTHQQLQGCCKPTDFIEVDWDQRLRLPALLVQKHDGCAFITANLLAVKTKINSMSIADTIVFLLERKAAMAIARVHARDCRTWESRRNAQIRARRISLIRQRLVYLEWGEEVQVLGSVLTVTLSSPSPPNSLTKPGLEAYMGEVRDQEAARKLEKLRLEKERLKWSKKIEKKNKRGTRKNRQQTNYYFYRVDVPGWSKNNVPDADQTRRLFSSYLHYALTLTVSIDPPWERETRPPTSSVGQYVFGIRLAPPKQSVIFTLHTQTSFLQYFAFT